MNFYLDPAEGHDDYLVSLALAVHAAGESVREPRIARGRTPADHARTGSASARANGGTASVGTTPIRTDRASALSNGAARKWGTRIRTDGASALSNGAGPGRGTTRHLTPVASGPAPH
jgi:hypothetical protein